MLWTWERINGSIYLEMVVGHIGVPVLGKDHMVGRGDGKIAFKRGL